MFRSFMLYNDIEHTIEEKDICIRMRPDIEFDNYICLSSFEEEYKNCLVYVANTHFNNNSWFCHKRDWDYMYISDKLGMYMACVDLRIFDACWMHFFSLDLSITNVVSVGYTFNEWVCDV